MLLVCGCLAPNPVFTEPAHDAPDGTETAPSPDTTPGDRLPPDATLVGDATETALPADALVVDGFLPEVAMPDAAQADATDAPEAGDALPPGATASARPVVVGPGGTTPPYGGTGGTLYTDDCATMGELVIGYAGYKETYTNSSNEYVLALQVICGRAEIPAGATVARIVSIRTATLRGDMRGTAWSAQCPQDQVVVGYTVLLDSEEQSENVRFHCAPLHVSPSGSGAIVPGAVTMLPWVGRLAGGSHTTANCPQGQAGSGHVARVGSWIDAFHMTCAVLSAGG